MYTDKDLEAEIKQEIFSRGEIDAISADWISNAVIKIHFPDGFEKHSDFITNCTWAHTRRIVGQVLRDLRPDENGKLGSTMELPGFEFLQSHYEVERVQGSLRTVARVARNLLTTAERRFLSSKLHANARALDRHGDELDRETDELIALGLLEPDHDAE